MSYWPHLAINREARAEATKAQSEAIQEKLSKIRPLKVEEVVEAFNVGLDKDSNGAALAVFPGLPPIDVPNFSGPAIYIIFAFLLFLSKLSPKTKGVNFAQVFLSILGLFAVFSFVLGVTLSCYFEI